MTIPRERTLAVQNVEVFLYRLTDPKLTPRISKTLRREAAWLLKHFPSLFHLEEAARALPDIWGPPISRGAWDRYTQYRAMKLVQKKIDNPKKRKKKRTGGKR